VATGINQNVEIGGRVFHVQTEFISADQPKIETTVFLDGRVVGSRKIPMLDDNPSQERLCELRDEQHATIVKNLVSRMANLQAKRAREQPAEVAEGVVPDPKTSVSLRASINARTLIGRFRGAIDVMPPYTHKELSLRLKATVSQIEGIVESPTFSDIRVDEQVRFSLLKERINEWQSGGQDHDTGVRIWSDAVVFSARLGEINCREELARYDQHTLATAVARIDSEGISDDDLELLTTLYGLDVQLDRMLDAPGYSAEQWSEALKRVLEELPQSHQ
jgi:hypothetical protein